MGGLSSESDGEAAVEEKKAASMAGFRRTGAAATQMPANVAQWEKHTTGIGSKLLLKMGYKPGMGLGKNLQGISTPIEAHVRKGRGAVGAYGAETAMKQADVKVARKMDEDERETREFKEKMQQWKREGTADKGKKFRYFYKTAEDIIQEKGGRKASALPDKSVANNKLSQVPVIDMTGPEKRVLSGYHALGQSRAAADEVIYDSSKPHKATTHFALPELMHNLNLIVDLCEQEIISNDKHQKMMQDKEVTLRRDTENLERVIELEKNHLDQLEETVDLVQALVNPNGTLTLPEAEQIFVILQQEFQSEYEDFGFSVLVAGVIAPLVNSNLKDWQPLESPTKYVDLLKRWREILRPQDISSETLFEPYSALVWAGIVPSIRAATSTWNPRHYEPMVALLDVWAPLFPTRILDNILEQIILPKLTAAVEEWDPLTDHTAIHKWIHPWTGLLADKLNERVYPMIREKLGNGLKAWMPSDRSAFGIIRPWKNVFTDADMQAFLVKHILLKLQAVLAELIINPLQQELGKLKGNSSQTTIYDAPYNNFRTTTVSELWHQVWEWHELLMGPMMAQLLDKFFFPKWMQTLVIWLNQNPNLDQVARWYSGWKDLLSEDIQQQPAIKDHLRRALELMHRATGTPIGLIPAATRPPDHIPVPQPPIIGDLSALSRAGAPLMQSVPSPVIEFKELVSQKCADRGIIFAPMPGRRELGKQVYRMGNMFCYIDRTVIMLGDGSMKNWSPVALAVALERAMNGDR